MNADTMTDIALAEARAAEPKNLTWGGQPSEPFRFVDAADPSSTESHSNKEALAAGADPAVGASCVSSALAEELPVAVIAVSTGHEHAAARRIARVAGDAVGAVFALERECPRRKGGVWSLERSLAYPGYVFVEVRDAKALEERLGLITQPHRLLTVGGAPSYLDERERAVVCGMGGTEHVIATSVGELVAGALTVTRGPLFGRERLIARIDPHRKSAWLVPLRHAERGLRIGLEVVAKR